MKKDYLKFLYVLLACYYILYMIYALYKVIVGEIGSIFTFQGYILPAFNQENIIKFCFI